MAKVSLRPLPLHLVLVMLAVGLAVTPALRLLCSDSCDLASGETAHDVGTSRGVPECHDDDDDNGDRSGSSPLDDDCTHAGESSRSNLSASVKSVSGDGARIAMVSVVDTVSPAIDRVHIRRVSPSTSRSGQLLALFVSPLRL